MQSYILFKKEMLNFWRDRKWIWVPLVFVLLAVMDPITTYYMPQILDAVGGLPDGAVIDFPEPSNIEVIMMSLGQLSTLGVLIIALSSMSMISGERKSGVAELILVKPVSFSAYVLSKWTALLTLTLSAFVISMLAAWYYIGVLYEFISVGDLLILIVFYSLWLLLVVSLSIFYNTVSKSPGLVAFLTIATLLAFNLVTMLLGERFNWSPNHISTYIHEALVSGEIPTDLYGASIFTVLLSILLLIVGSYIFKNKEHAE
ncbi:ABC transporter permease [Oceanobacillus sp. CAU 1775]